LIAKWIIGRSPGFEPGEVSSILTFAPVWEFQWTLEGNLDEASFSLV
jgi:hypothetical protein